MCSVLYTNSSIADRLVHADALFTSIMKSVPSQIARLILSSDLFLSYSNRGCLRHTKPNAHFGCPKALNARNRRLFIARSIGQETSDIKVEENKDAYSAAAGATDLPERRE